MSKPIRAASPDRVFGRERLDIDPRQERMWKRRKHLRCALCPPHGGENVTRYSRHGAAKPRYKEHRVR